jgi:molecular chaperone GrpE
MANVRKRLQQEKEESIAYANGQMILRLLPVLDDFDLAIQHAESQPDFDALMSGVRQILKKLQETLAKEGVESIEAVGQAFDTAEHEAIGQVETDEFPEGTVARELRRGYRMKGRCLRPSIVQVAVP